MLSVVVDKVSPMNPPPEIPLWTGRAPHAIGDEPVDVPSLQIFKPAGEYRSAVVVCPGGGYQNLAPHEGGVFGQWLSEQGLLAAVVKYRLGPRYRHPAPLADASRAIRTVRSSATSLGIAPDKIAILGFSAGGHLASSASTIFDAGNPSAADEIDRVSSRPDASILAYPVISLQSPFAHRGSRNNLLGEDCSESAAAAMSTHLLVTPQTPPTFLFHTLEDGPVPVDNSIAYLAACRAAKVPVEAHFYGKGNHGVGLALNNPHLSTWAPLAVSWLRSMGW
jgi:acetyl esterase/lipase